MLSLLLLTSCSPFEGTWALVMDLVPDVAGDCADEQADQEASSNEPILVDFYHLANGHWLATIDRPMTGTANQTEIELAWVEVLDYDGYTATNSEVLRGTWDSPTLTGSYTVETWEETDGGNDYSCTSAWAYAGSRVASNRADYMEVE